MALPSKDVIAALTISPQPIHSLPFSPASTRTSP